MIKIFFNYLAIKFFLLIYCSKKLLILFLNCIFKLLFQQQFSLKIFLTQMIQVMNLIVGLINNNSITFGTAKKEVFNLKVNFIINIYTIQIVKRNRILTQENFNILICYKNFHVMVLSNKDLLDYQLNLLNLKLLSLMRHKFIKSCFKMMNLKNLLRFTTFVNKFNQILKAIVNINNYIIQLILYKNIKEPTKSKITKFRIKVKTFYQIVQAVKNI
ncbi:transmembrane protein, putative (macronuclear) [Tetrahymena thermophila SB210]|uniref:Transmembrane protein, putative n=1 Tax=Tetrahymena thermophila (strain SB210) TaxID=312017 RepID=W7X4Y5_TETTS|nr:transmembrane protein, putative [Tetrahymena thermophila SB210]EWS74410.1 transmembrane protein, putative [Tetrahymena thermophila SB210]|eukprot:XP_012653087.1 transmembrane protein, putative [Tetrahymena thermophila SB210]